MQNNKFISIVVWGEISRAKELNEVKRHKRSRAHAFIQALIWCSNESRLFVMNCLPFSFASSHWTIVHPLRVASSSYYTAIYILDVEHNICYKSAANECQWKKLLLFCFFSPSSTKRKKEEITFTSSNDFNSKQMYAERMLTPVLRRCVLRGRRLGRLYLNVNFLHCILFSFFALVFSRPRRVNLCIFSETSDPWLLTRIIPAIGR